ncbi:MAG TPA: condensation domain-containing protein, partial [Longimicrobium sp.]|nr:condensation domain-containing protein [Longimicrobium sp.]
LYRSGDVARRSAAGELEYAGRGDAQVKVRGFRIELGEIEAALLAQPGVREAVVTVRGRESEERSLVGYIVGEGLSVEALREGLRGVLPEYMVPGALVVLDALPLTVNGKVDRARLPEVGEGEGVAGAGEYEAPEGEVERVLAEVWAEVLGVERVGRGDRFFDLGGHSLRATQAAARVRARLGAEMPLRALFEGATLAEVAARVEVGEQGGAGRIERVARDGSALPLSYAQERLWFIDRMEPGSAAYNMGMGLRLAGELDRSAMERALAEVVRRHESLRTTFRVEDGVPAQHVAEAGWSPLDCIDLSPLPANEREAELRRIATTEAERPFDLEAGPLFRAGLVRLGEREHALLLCAHHAVSDGWSTGVLLRELGALYGAYLRGQPSPLPELPVQYADYAAWQRRHLAGEAMARQAAYWRERLAGAPALLELPTDRPRPAVQTHRGDRLHAGLPAPVLDALRAVGHARGATLFMTLQGAWVALLGRYAGQEDVVVGSPVAGRAWAETEGLIGLFVN